MKPVTLSKRFLVYIPTYNCAATIPNVLEKIPHAIWEYADILVVDNKSSDGTADKVREIDASNTLPGIVQIVQPEQNLGYAGSQKLAYETARKSMQTQWVIMLHGDGQYPPELLPKFLEQAAETPEAASIYGFRSKKHYPYDEETPWLTYSMIKALGCFESLVTGVRRKEWHSGYVMYATEFLRKVDLSKLTKTMHIDGHLQFATSRIGMPSVPLPIFKRYRELEAFAGISRIKYVFQVLYMCFRFRFQSIHQETACGAEVPASGVHFDVQVLSSHGKHEVPERKAA